jgi:hypothetical protein
MSNIIRIKGKLTTGAPQLADLVDRELCIVIPDGDLYGRVNNTMVYLGGSKKADRDSPTFTGTPSSTTPGVNDNSTRIATTAFVQAVVAALGAGAGDMLKSVYDTDNDGKVNAAVNADQLGGVAAANYATQAFVNQAVANLVNTAPGALDTLNELAAALGNDANFASTVSGQIASKLDANSTIDGGTL